MAAITSPAIVARSGSCTPIHIPLYQKSYGYRVKRYNGTRDWHYLQTPMRLVPLRFALSAAMVLPAATARVVR
jgi:hypothetical protein